MHDDLAGARVVRLDDRDELAAFFMRRNPLLHLYAIGDLDPWFWERTTWHGLRDDAGLQAVCLTYAGGGSPVLLALCDPAEAPAMRRLLASVRETLPATFYAHLSPGVAEAFGPAYALRPAGRHHKLALVDPDPLAEYDATGVEPLSPADAPALQQLYARGYPGSWFDPRMLETGRFVGIRADGRIVAVAGVHVVAPRYGVAALGNIVTDPDHRGRGLAQRATAALCRRLRAEDPPVTVIGLNVHAANAPALACYRRLGFAWVADYDEATVTRLS